MRARPTPPGRGRRLPISQPPACPAPEEIFVTSSHAEGRFWGACTCPCTCTGAHLEEVCFRRARVRSETSPAHSFLSLLLLLLLLLCSRHGISQRHYCECPLILQRGWIRRLMQMQTCLRNPKGRSYWLSGTKNISIALH